MGAIVLDVRSARKYTLGMPQNRQFRLASRPSGPPARANFELTEEAVPEPAEGEVLVQVQYLSLDPAMRGWMTDARSYIEPVAVGAVMRALGAGRVVASRDPAFAPGDAVTGLFGVQEYALLGGSGLAKARLDLAPLSTYLGGLGLTGLTAYFGLLDVGRPRAGETVVVSAAAGATGSVASQIAKIKGCRAVGIAGGAEKCRFLVEELGLDAAIDYKSEELVPALKAHCPNGVDVYFDNVGGAMLDAALARLARRGRVVLCGAISQYNRPDAIEGPRNYLSLLRQRGRMEGFITFDYRERYGEALAALGGWLKGGQLKLQEEVVTGFETFPDALLKLFRGENRGKLVLKIAD